MVPWAGRQIRDYECPRAAGGSRQKVQSYVNLWLGIFGQKVLYCEGSAWLAISIPLGILLFGPSSVGKSMQAHRIILTT